MRPDDAKTYIHRVYLNYSSPAFVTAHGHCYVSMNLLRQQGTSIILIGVLLFFEAELLTSSVPALVSSVSGSLPCPASGKSEVSQTGPVPDGLPEQGHGEKPA